jgi:type I restriction enzyme M protein
MIDASKGFVKDGNKNRLREQDIRKITDVFSAQLEVPKYSRMVSMSEIADAKNDYNLNIPRYIDTQEAEDIQNIEAHLLGGIPEADMAGLEAYWQVFPGLKNDLFETLRPGYVALKVAPNELKQGIFTHPEFVAYNQTIQTAYEQWLNQQKAQWENLSEGAHPKEVITESTAALFGTMTDTRLIDTYDLYQHLMQYWNETMQDDVYTVAMDRWKAGAEYERLVVKGKPDKNGKTKADKEIAGLAGIAGRMISPDLLIETYFEAEKQAIAEQENVVETAQARLTEIEEEQSSEEGLFADLEKVNSTEVAKLIKDKTRAWSGAEMSVLKEYIAQADAIKKANAEIKKLNTELEAKVLAKYPTLSEADVKQLVIHRKWQGALAQALTQEQEKISQNLTGRIKALAERYAVTLPSLEAEVLEALIIID